MNPADAALTLPEELLLLSLDPVTGRRLCPGRFLEYGLAGAVLAELERTGRILVDHGCPAVVNPVPPADPLLAAAIATLPPPGKGRASRGPKAHRWVRRTSRHLAEPWLERLVERGLLRVETHRFLGLIPYRRHPVGPVDRTTQARHRLAVAAEAGFAEPRERVLAALLGATGAGSRLFPGREGRHTRGAMRRLAREVWTAKAVHRNVQADQASGSSSGDGGGGGGDGG